eukprot:3941962-Rhodomonas_salina.1
MCGTDLVHVAISLRACYAVCGTELAYGTASLCDIKYWPCVCCCPPTLCAVLSSCMQVWKACVGEHVRRNGLSAMSRGASGMPCPILLRACYAMSGTDLARGAISLRTAYDMSGTSPIVLRASYARSGTDLAYCALPGVSVGGCIAWYQVRYLPTQYSILRYGVWCATGLRACYAKSGTAIAHGAVPRAVLA